MYERGQIYAIIDEEGMEVYIGSTCNELYKRWNDHKRNAKLHPDRDIYKYIMENGGFEKFRIVLVEDYPCSCKKELVRREGELIKSFNPVGNRYIAGRTKSEWLDDNKEKILERLREWREDNKEKIQEKNRKYHEQNKEKILEQRREYREQNKDKIRERDRKYREQNRDKINERRRKQYRNKKGEL